MSDSFREGMIADAEVQAWRDANPKKYAKMLAEAKAEEAKRKQRIDTARNNLIEHLKRFLKRAEESGSRRGYGYRLQEDVIKAAVYVSQMSYRAPE